MVGVSQYLELSKGKLRGRVASPSRPFPVASFPVFTSDNWPGRGLVLQGHRLVYTPSWQYVALRDRDPHPPPQNPPSFDWPARTKMLAPFPSRRDPVSETDHGIIDAVLPGLKIRLGFWDLFKFDSESNKSETQWLDIDIPRTVFWITGNAGRYSAVSGQAFSAPSGLEILNTAMWGAIKIMILKLMHGIEIETGLHDIG